MTVVGVDNSEASKAALRLAAQEARWRQAPLVAVSAYELPIGPAGGFPGAAMLGARSRSSQVRPQTKPRPAAMKTGSRA